MNLKLRRMVRTPHSEQYALFDLDRADDNYDPQSIGKLDLHYTSDGVYGTFLLWRKAIAHLPSDQVHGFVEATIQELCEPVGLPAFFAIEYFSPDLQNYALHSSVETVLSASSSGQRFHSDENKDSTGQA